MGTRLVDVIKAIIKLGEEPKTVMDPVKSETAELVVMEYGMLPVLPETSGILSLSLSLSLARARALSLCMCVCVCVCVCAQFNKAEYFYYDDPCNGDLHEVAFFICRI